MTLKKLLGIIVSAAFITVSASACANASATAQTGSTAASGETAKELRTIRVGHMTGLPNQYADYIGTQQGIYEKYGIKLETSEKNETVFVSVKDSGIGIPKDSLKLIFDRFYKTDPTRGRDKKGTGLGLSIVKEIINAHHEWL